MDVWISAGVTVLVALITGWFARAGGVRQAKATLEAVQQTLGEQRTERTLAARRAAYRDFLAAANDVNEAGRASGSGDARAALRRALDNVELEGPDPVTAAAVYLTDFLRGRAGQDTDTFESARRKFIDAARAALSLSDD